MAYLCKLVVLAVLWTALGAFNSADAQALRRLRDRAKERVEENLGRKQDEAIDAAMQGDEASETEAAQDAASETTASGTSPESTGEESARLKPGEGAWANYDFIPGERPLYVDDFSSDVAGNFPQRMEFRSGNMEIVEWQGKRWLRAEGGELYINLAEPLPERFTMEFDLAGSGNAMTITFDNDEFQNRTLEINASSAWIRSGNVNGEGSLGVSTNERPVRIRISVDGPYVKLYADEKRALNVPNADLGRSNRIYMNLNGWSAEDPRLISDVQVMAGGRKLYDGLIAEGRVVTQGLFFDTGSDRLRGESTPTLKEIGQMLQEHPDLRLRIEGHTDNTGSADANRSLSERRAAAVKDFLVAEFNVDAARLQSAGLGSDNPVADNSTPEGRQANRRVELVKL